jgi:molybdopterin converting factor small subunit
MVEVRLFANLREAAGKESLFLEFADPPTVGAMLERLLAELPALGKILIMDGKYDDRYKVLVGGEIVFPEEFGSKLGTKFAILPPVSGG